MKIGNTSMRMLSVCITLALFMGSNCPIDAQDDQMKLSFDTIFPATAYKDALGSCMQMLGYLDQLCYEHERAEEMSIALVHDAFFGKVVHAQHKITHLIADIKSGAVVADDNVHYLNTILSHINQLYQKRLDKDQRNTLAVSILEDMVSQVSRITE